MVKVLSMASRHYLTVKAHCQVWLDNASLPIVVVPATYRLIYRYNWNGAAKGAKTGMEPQLITCDIPLVCLLSNLNIDVVHWLSS